MLTSVIVVCFMVGVICMMFVTPVKYAKGIRMIMYDGIPESERTKCYIPFYNVVTSESLYTGRVSVVLITSIVFLVTILFRLLVLFVLYSSAWLQFISVILIVVGIVVAYIGNFYAVFVVLHDSGAIGIVKQILYSIAFPMGQNYIGVYLPSAIFAAAQEEETF